jgi:sensor histidine kinase YesM
MRYLLYESGRGTTTLTKEAEFMKSYVKLMQLRVDENVKVDLELPKVINNVSLPPLLFISFIENAFKHGVSSREPSSISFKLLQHPHSLEFVAINSIPSSFLNSTSKKQGGIGLENIRKRLDLLFGDKYKLDIDVSDTEFKVNLIIPS